MYQIFTSELKIIRSLLSSVNAKLYFDIFFLLKLVKFINVSFSSFLFTKKTILNLEF